MKSVFLALLLCGFSASAFAECYELNSDQKPASADRICLSPERAPNVRMYLGKKLVYKAKVDVQFIPEHETCGKTRETTRCGIIVKAAYTYSNLSKSKDPRQNVLIEATVPAERPDGRTNSGCHGIVFAYHPELERLCFYPDLPILN